MFSDVRGEGLRRSAVSLVNRSAIVMTGTLLAKYSVGRVGKCNISVLSYPNPRKTEPIGPLTVTETERLKFKSTEVLLPGFIYSPVHTKPLLFQGWQRNFLFVSVLNSPDTVKVK